jgi:hypothetical protein
MNLKRVMLSVLLVFVFVSCNKKSSTPGPQSAGSTSTAVASRDYTTPYLTDDKMQKFLQSMSESQNPFESMFGQAGRAPGSIPGEVAALDTFARKYGFQGYQDYMAVWGRIVVGEMTIMAEGMKKGVREMTEKNIQNAEEQLRNPSLSADMRKIYEDQVTSGKKSLQDLDKPSSSKFNDNDLAMVRKYQPQIEEASKKYNKRAAQGQ